MAQRILHPEWQDYHQTTKYPFADRATLANSNGDFFLAGSFLDAVLYPPGAVGRFYISRVEILPDQYQIFIGDAGSTEVAVGTFDPGVAPDRIVLYDSSNRPAGMLLPGDVSLLQTWEPGSHIFNVDQTEFVARVCVSTPEIGVRGVLVDDGEGNEVVMTGQVYLVGEDGVVLRYQTINAKGGPFEPDEIRQVIRMDVVGDPLFRRALCAGVFQSGRYLQQLTFQQGGNSFICGPSDTGDIQISVGSEAASDTVLRIRSTERGLVFEAVGERVEG